MDYTGSSEFGDWIEQNVTHAVVFTEKAGINSIVLDSIDNLKAVTGNIAFTLSLYSGQMCTTSQNIFIPRDGSSTGRRSRVERSAAAPMATASRPSRALTSGGAPVRRAARNAPCSRKVEPW